MVGFLLIRREVIAFFDVSLEEKVFITQAYATVFRELKGVITSVEGSTSIVMGLKEYFSIFHRILRILNISSDNNQYQGYIIELLKIFNTRNEDTLHVDSVEHIAKDNMTHYST